MTARLEFGVLGPVRVTRDGEPVRLSGVMLRRLLAVLLCTPGEPVAVGDLVDELWAGAPPPSSRKTLQVYVRRLRTALGDECRITHDVAGYAVTVAPDELDALRFLELAAAGRAARRAGDPRAASVHFGHALELWRGPAYAEVTDLRVVAGEARRLEEQRLQVCEERVATELDQGRHAELISDLAALVEQHPYREQLRVQLMLALYRSGQRAAALEVYRAARALFHDELGIEPGPVLQRTHEAVLRDDTALELAGVTPAAMTDPAPTDRRVPCQLPLTMPGFAGRTVELAALDDLVRPTGPGGPIPRLMLIIGTAGVGKTALAVHWARRVAERFPDGQLYVNLRGFHPGGSGMPAMDALRGFLDALGVAADRIPPDADARTALYRNRLAGKRMLVVLDNARDAEQVRPLLPGTADCAVIVTSRNRLSGLVAVDGARPLVLDLLSTAEARLLLAGRLGADRVAAEPHAVAEIIDRCARLPLALAIVAARAVTRPGLALAALAEELRESPGGLDPFSDDDASADVRAVFSWSYHALRAETARLFRLLGLHPGPDISTRAAASLAAQPRVRRLLSELCGAHLIIEHTPGRYGFHDLLRAYANELATAVDSAAEREAALRRLLDHYLHTGHTAARIMNPNGEPITVDPPDPGAVLEPIADRDRAVAWFTAERQVLLAAIEQAGRAGFDGQAWRLAWTLDTVCQWQGHWHDQIAAHRIGLAAAERLGDAGAQAYAHRGLGNAHARLRDYDRAVTHLRRALDLVRRVGDELRQAFVHMDLCWLRSELQQQHEAGLDHAEQALRLYRAVDHRNGLGRSLNAVGWCHNQLGDRAAALGYLKQALEVHAETGDLSAQAAAWDSLGDVYRQSGDHHQAIGCFREALELVRALGIRYYEAYTLQHLGDAKHALGDHDDAIAVWEQAHRILEELDHPDAEQVRAKLRG